MSDAERLPYSLELPAAAPVRIGDLPGMMAGAMHTGEVARAAAEDGIWRALRAMVDAGTLQPLNALTMLPHECPYGDGLRRAVLLPFSIRPILHAQGIELRLIEPGNGPDHWSLENAARDIGEIQGWSKRQAETLCEQMLDAARGGVLVVRNPHTALPVPLHKRATVRDFYELVTRDDVNVWLVSIGAPYRWVTYEQAAAEPRYIAGKLLWCLPDAIESIAAMPGFNVSADDLKARIQRDAEQGKLTLRDQAHGAEIKSDWGAIVMSYHLYAEDFNAWLKAAGYPEPYRLRDDLTSEQSKHKRVATAAELPQVAAMPTKASQAAEKEAREDARLAHCEAEGIIFDKAALLRLPDGIAKAAATLEPPIRRQSLSTDVKAALRRRFERARNGKG